jgi:putative PIN family toxin of toxin-antitoxin system
VIVLLDTNIIISASMNNIGNPYLAFMKAIAPPFRWVVCELNLTELYGVYNRKFPDKIELLDKFLEYVLRELEVIPVPVEKFDIEADIRDVKDRPILRAAINYGVDILITGDKDFLESGVTTPKIMTAYEFVRLSNID